MKLALAQCQRWFFVLFQLIGSLAVMRSRWS